MFNHTNIEKKLSITTQILTVIVKQVMIMKILPRKTWQHNETTEEENNMELNTAGQRNMTCHWRFYGWR